MLAISEKSEKVEIDEPTGKPLLASVPEACRQLGSIGKTAFYDAVKRHKIKLVKLGGRSLVPMTEIERVVVELMAETPPDSSERAKALALRSVKARRAKRRIGPGIADPPAITTRRSKRGSTEP